MKYDVLLYRVTMNVQLVGRECRIRVPYRYPAQYQHLVFNLQFPSHHLGISGY